MRLALLSACLLFTGCGGRAARAKPNLVTIPIHCIKVTIKDFTKPCRNLAGGDLMCDQVKVHVQCTAVTR